LAAINGESFVVYLWQRSTFSAFDISPPMRPFNARIMLNGHGEKPGIRPPSVNLFMFNSRIFAMTPMIEFSAQKLSPQAASDGAKDMSAPCPKCRVAMIFVTALPHPHAPSMRRTVFLCTPCNQTRNYSLSAEMAEIYAALFPPPEG
jgi:hypothetical protein